MSAFMVDDITINRIVAGIEKADIDNDFVYLPWHFLTQLGLPDIEPENSARLGQMLLDMNIEAIEQRYGKDEVEKFRPLDYQYRPEAFITRIQFYKSLGCLLYQCCEGNVPDTPIYKLFDRLKDAIASTIVHQLPAYEKATWG